MSNPTQTVHIELERDEANALIAGSEGRNEPPPLIPARRKLHEALHAALSSSPEQGGEGQSWAPEPDVDLDPMHGRGAHEAWQDGWAKGHAAAAQPPAPALSDEGREKIGRLAEMLEALGCEPDKWPTFLRTLASRL